jgi:hypothetical protein
MSRAEYMREYRKKKKLSENSMCLLTIYEDDDRENGIRFDSMKTSKALEIKSLLDDRYNHLVEILLV